MKKALQILAGIVFSGVMFFTSCKKDTVCDGCNENNKPPIALAGPDQVITFPSNSVLLDGSASYDPDEKISEWRWRKIDGPASFNISKPTASITALKNLIPADYQFELTVTDNLGWSAKDTVLIRVNVENRPVVNAQLIPIGTLSQPRAGMAIASTANKVLFAGGLEASTGVLHPTSRVDIWDLTTNTWSTSELCVKRYQIAATACGGKIFFGGGEYYDGTWPVDSVDIYDAANNTWITSHLSVAGNGISAATVGSKVFFAGGDGGVTSPYRGSVVDIFDLNTNSWSSASLSEPRKGVSAVTVNNKIYFSGGFNYPLESKGIDIYDNATGFWSTDTLQEAKSYHGGIAAGNRIFWAGGVISSDLTSKVEIKNVNTGTTSIEYFFRPADWHSYDGQHLLMKDNKIVFLTTWGPYMDKFDIYDLTTNKWSIGLLPQPLPTWASFMSVNNTIYVAGGSIMNLGITNQVWKLEF